MVDFLLILIIRSQCPLTFTGLVILSNMLVTIKSQLLLVYYGKYFPVPQS